MFQKEHLTNSIIIFTHFENFFAKNGNSKISLRKSFHIRNTIIRERIWTDSFENLKILIFENSGHLNDLKRSRLEILESVPDSRLLVFDFLKIWVGVKVGCQK